MGPKWRAKVTLVEITDECFGHTSYDDAEDEKAEIGS
jgi:hypothetical protein